MDYSLEQEVSAKINSILSANYKDNSNYEQLLADLRKLRNLCAQGQHVQLSIVSHEELQKFVQELLFATNVAEEKKPLTIVAWQLLANSTVGNVEALQLIWKMHGSSILQMCNDLQRPLESTNDIALMIVYNILKTGELNDIKSVLQAVVSVWRSIVQQKSNLQFEFLHFVFEEFLVNDGRRTVKYYAQLETEERLAFLDYLTSYLKQDSPNGLVHSFMLQHLSKEFKIKSDCILKVSSLQQVDQIKPKEAYALLRSIACASGSEHYTQVYAADHSLFLNVSSLLRCLVEVGKSVEKNLFTPMNKLEEVAPSSNISKDYQYEISYELKTLLVRCIANLLYKNPTNQGYCLDTQVMPALFECTNMDARNPLMKEWSILAIRNACIGCPEIQQVIANLTKQGPANNDILDELNLEMGSLRINPNKG